MVLVTETLAFICPITYSGLSTQSIICYSCLFSLQVSQPEIFQCKVCHQHLSSAYNLKIHMRRHTNEMPFKCPLCSQTFKHSNSCHRHIRTHQLNIRADIPCKVCGKVFPKSKALDLHLQSHFKGSGCIKP
jgi:uncharacterized Zn-finger protein